MPDYDLVSAQIRSLAETDARWLPMLANASALLAAEMDDVNWVGFYLTDPAGEPDADGGRPLVLGPFQGKVACVGIPVGRGVCGTAALRDETVLVKDVHQFPGHIACDAASASEVVVPMHAGGRVVGVLDVDSPTPARFSQKDRAGLMRVVAALEEAVELEVLIDKNASKVAR